MYSPDLPISNPDEIRGETLDRVPTRPNKIVRLMQEARERGITLTELIKEQIVADSSPSLKDEDHNLQNAEDVNSVE